MRRSRLSNSAAIVLLISLPEVPCARAATVSLQAVKLNGAPIAPTNDITAAAEDVIEADMFVSGWGPQLPGGVRVFQLHLDGRVGFRSGENGTVLPLGWDAPLAPIPCSNDTQCTDPHWPICVGLDGCRGPNHNPTLGVFMDRTRPDFMFHQQVGQFAIDTLGPNYRFLGLAEDPQATTPDLGIPRYCGTVILRVSANACGVFTIGFITEYESTILADGSPKPNVIIPRSSPLIVQTPQCPILPAYGWCNPGHCTIDARIPHSQSFPPQRFTMNQVIEFVPEGADGLTRFDFAVSQFPDVGAVPGVSAVATEVVEADVSLNRRINPNVWTCVRQLFFERQCCMASLPGDVDGDRTSRVFDIFELLDNLHGEIPGGLAIERCDIDRSGLCAPADILWEADLLNGSGVFEEFNGHGLPPCPPQRLDR